MSKLGTIGFKNNDGHSYDFSIYTMDAALKPGHGGGYIITSRHDDDKTHHGHHIIMIGESDDMSVLMAAYPNQAEFDAERANCCCVHATQDQAARTRIVGELTERYLNKS